MTYYAILHKPSNAFFPTFKGGQRRGSTYVNLPFSGAPRIFTTKTAAKNCLAWWLAGLTEPVYDTNGWGGGSIPVGASPGKGDPNRKAEEMSIVEIELHCKQGVLL